MTGSRLLLGLLAGAALATGCATPRIVTQITSRDGQAKFLYVQNRDQGLVQCKVAANGDLSDCADKPIVFKDPQ